MTHGDLSFGMQLKQRRKALDLTRTELAERVGCSVKTIEKFESGERRPSKQLAALLAERLALPHAARLQFIRLARGIPAGEPIGSTTAPVEGSTAEGMARHSVPTPTDVFVGREALVVKTRTLLRRPYTRLVTLTGPGGIGKTRLAVELAGELVDDFADGVVFVGLAAVPDPALVVPTIAHTLGIPLATTSAPGPALQRALRNYQLLLILDNCEHVLAAAPEIAALLTACHGIKVLVTSRESLGVRYEHQVHVPPLTLPTTDDQRNALARSEAVQLFMARAQEAQATDLLAVPDLPIVASICARLEGVPLAIELVAAWTTELSPAAIVDQLGSRLHVATAPGIGRPVRQRTLHAAIDWSYQLLTEAEQALFCGLAVFADGFTVAAAHAVCGAPDGSAAAMLVRLETLLDKSLLQYVDTGTVEPRFRMLETVREFAGACLDTRGQRRSLEERHAQYFLALAERAEPALRGVEKKAWLDRLERDHGNVRVALRWTLTLGTPDLSLRLCAALAMFWYFRTYLREGREWFAAALGRVHAVDRELQARAYNGAGVLAWGQDDAGEAITCYQQSLAIWRELGNTAQITNTLYNIAGMLITTRAYIAAKPILEEVLELARALEMPQRISATLNRLSIVAEQTGDLAGAARLCTESIAIDRELRDIRHIAIMQSRLGHIALKQHQPDRAEQLFRAGLQIFRELGDQDGVISMIEWLGAAAADRNAARAAHLFGAATAFRAALHIGWSAHDRALYQPYLDTAHTQLDAYAWDVAWASGQRMTQEHAVAFALDGDRLGRG